MARTNTSATYGSVTKTFHWLVAFLVLTEIPLGVIASDMAYDTSDALARKAVLFSLHKTVGIAIFLVAAMRIIWAVSQPKPGLLNAEKPKEAFLAETVHWLLYVSLVVVPLTGWIDHAATSGFAPIWWPFGQSLPFIPKNETLAVVFASLHFTFVIVLAVAICLHVAGALKHHFIDRDQTLRRMLPGQIDAVLPPKHAKSRLPVIGAIAAYTVALFIGTAVGLLADSPDKGPSAQLESVDSGWIVTEGTLGLTVEQFGNEVRGEFPDWTASITFDETADSDLRGHVDATILIGSLSLGSVTNQALGFDFFDVESFPTATFSADILAVDDGYLAKGTLTLKSTEVPVEMLFNLDINGDVARMSGNTRLDRRAFAIGDTFDDENTLGFLVRVNLSLAATRAK